jgi:hypothetical protein
MSFLVLRNITDEANRMAVRSLDVILMYLPLFHAFGLYGGPSTYWPASRRAGQYRASGTPGTKGLVPYRASAGP